MELIGRRRAGVAHDFNNILAAILCTWGSSRRVKPWTGNPGLPKGVEKEVLRVVPLHAATPGLQPPAGHGAQAASTSVSSCRAC